MLVFVVRDPAGLVFSRRAIIRCFPVGSGRVEIYRAGILLVVSERFLAYKVQRGKFTPATIFRRSARERSHKRCIPSD